MLGHDETRHCEEPTGPAFGGPDDKLRDEAIHPSSFRDGPKDQTSDVQLHIGESRDSGFDAEPVTGLCFARTRWHRPGMTASIGVSINPASHSLWQ